jgi:site-specific recombinase XerD
MPKSKIHTDLLVQFFAANPDQVFALSDLEYLFIEKHREWNLPPSMTSYTFLEMLRTRFKLCELQLRSRHYSSLVLYAVTSQKGGRIHRSQFFRVFQSIAERAGLPADRRHPHCLKHALGFALVAGNVHLSIVKQALGHRNIASTALYAVPTDEQTGKAVNSALANLF